MFHKKKYTLANKLVLVTGASSGIGATTAKAFAKQGTRLALTARNKEKLDAVKNEICAEGGKVEIFPFDLDKIEHISELIEQIEEHFQDTVDVLVNSAGIAVLGLVENVPLGAYRQNLQINFFASFGLIQAVLPGMKKKRSGQIINLFSGVGKRGLPGVSSYCVSKFALNGLTESLRVEVLPYNVDVILFSPGLVQTGFGKKLKLYGRLKETFTTGNAVTAEFTAKKIVEASLRRKRDVVLSLKTRVAIHLNYWFPALSDKILARKL